MTFQNLELIQQRQLTNVIIRVFYPTTPEKLAQKAARLGVDPAHFMYLPQNSYEDMWAVLKDLGSAIDKNHQEEFMLKEMQASGLAHAL